MKAEKPILFLDIDGVLNRCDASNQGLEPDKVDQLQRIVEACDPVIIISSTWRMHGHLLKRITKMLLDIGSQNYGGITDYEDGPAYKRFYHADSRASEIQDWITLWAPNCRTFVILDDMEDMEHLAHHHVKTESHAGLTPEIADQVIAALRR